MGDKATRARELKEQAEQRCQTFKKLQGEFGRLSFEMGFVPPALLQHAEASRTRIFKGLPTSSLPTIPELPEDVDSLTDPREVGDLRRSVQKFTEACRTSVNEAKNASHRRKPEDFGWRSNPFNSAPGYYGKFLPEIIIESIIEWMRTIGCNDQEIYRFCVTVGIDYKYQSHSIYGFGNCRYPGPMIPRHMDASITMKSVGGVDHVILVNYNVLASRTPEGSFHYNITTKSPKRMVCVWLIPIDSISRTRAINSKKGKVENYFDEKSRLSRFDGAWSIQIPSKSTERAVAKFLDPDWLSITEKAYGLDISLRGFPTVELTSDPVDSEGNLRAACPGSPGSLHYKEDYGSMPRFSEVYDRYFPRVYIDTESQKHDPCLLGDWRFAIVARGSSRRLQDALLLLPVDGGYSRAKWIRLGRHIHADFTTTTKILFHCLGSSEWNIRIDRGDKSFIDFHLSESDLVPISAPDGAEQEVNESAALLMNGLDVDELPQVVQPVFATKTNASIIDMLVSEEIGMYTKTRVLYYLHPVIMSSPDGIAFDVCNLVRKPTVLATSQFATIVAKPGNDPKMGLRWPVR